MILVYDRGGIFANGAVTGAFGYLFNWSMHEGMQTDEAGVEKHRGPDRRLIDYDDLNANIAAAGDMSVLDWYDKVKPGGEWDYKLQPKTLCMFGCENFGNLNYGATGGAQGFSLGTLQRSAGFVSEYFGTYDRSYGHFYLGPPYGDAPHDQMWIRRGFDAYQGHR